jgi:uncharacterized phage-associated protein
MSQIQYTAPQLANYLLHKVNHAGGETINTLKLNALLYYAEAWSLAVFERELLDEELQACDHGPLFPSLWAKLNSKGWNRLAANDLEDCAIPLDEDMRGLLDDVWQAYGEFNHTELIRKIKQDEPWKMARRGLQDWDLDKRRIDKQNLATFYKTVLEAEDQTAR